MITYRFFIGALLCMFCASMAQAQVVLPDRNRETALRENVFGLGIWGGPATGLGLSFRHHLPSPMSYQITGGIIKVNEQVSYDFGGELQFDLARGATSRFFVAGGMGYYYSGKASKNDLSAPGRLGMGVGAEVAFGSGIHGSGEILFTYFTDGTVLPLPQFGFHYYFY